MKVISLPYIFQVLYVLCFTRPRYQVSVYRTIGPLVCLFYLLFMKVLLLFYIQFQFLSEFQNLSFISDPFQFTFTNVSELCTVRKLLLFFFFILFHVYFHFHICMTVCIHVHLHVNILYFMHHNILLYPKRP